MKKSKFTSMRTVLGLTALFLIISVFFVGFTVFGNKISKEQDQELMSKSPEDDALPGTYVYFNGSKYKFRNDLLICLLMGIDDMGEAFEKDSYIGSSQADFNALCVFDPVSQECNVIFLNRDTMTEITMLGATGEKVGTKTAQLALAHSYGTGMNDSCRNAVKAVSDLLYGIDIEYYVAMNMDAVAILNDIVGGVEVEVLDDFSKVDPYLVQGHTVKLTGKKALTYVRSRYDVGDETNISRMARQKQYSFALTEKLKLSYEKNENIIFRIYESLNPYMVTNCSVNVLSDLVKRFSSYTINDFITPEGKSVKGERFMEFYPDEDNLKTLVVDLFYNKCE